MVKFTGKFVQISDSNYQNFLSKIGCGPMFIKMFTSSPATTMEITENKGKWKFETSNIKTKIFMEFELVNHMIHLL